MRKTRMNRLVAAAIAFACGLAAWAMPTKEELMQAQELVKDLTADDVRALKSGAKKPGEVAAAQVALADEAETEAGKYLLLQGAFRLYSRSADYDAAADVLARMRRDISDLPPEVVVELVTGEFRRVAAGKAEKVMVIYRDARRTIRYRKELAAAEKAATAKPSDAAVQRRVAECHAVLGDWAKALEAFAKLGVEAAKFELDPASAKGCDASKAADFWWNYPTKDSEPFQVHAAVLYRKGLADGSISGLRKTLAEKRVKQMEPVLPAADEAPALGSGAPAAPQRSDTPVASAKVPPNALYCVIDLSAGPSASRYPAKWLSSPPTGGFNKNEYTTTKLILRRIKPGSFKMLGQYDVTITKPYYIAEFPISGRQYELVTGKKPPVVSAEDTASVSWDTARGQSDVYNWPTVKTVDPTSFIGLLRSRTGLALDLPTEAQWEFAYPSCKWNIVTENQELCLDWWVKDDFLKNGSVDPEGPHKSNENLKVLRMKSGRARVPPSSDSFVTKGRNKTKRVWHRTIRLCMSVGNE